ncbi:fasciclin domain-containing protein [Aquimarina addita]
MRTVRLFSILVVSGVLAISCNQNEKSNDAQNNSEGLIAQASIPVEEKIPTIQEIIASDIGFTELKKLVQSSEFEEIFNQKGPYTIFAPLNGAFNKLPKGSLENILKPENKDQLSAIMNCHIIPRVINEADMQKAIEEGKGSITLETINGTNLIASLKRGKIYLIDKNGNAGRLMTTDIEATNGIVHTIESVMLPKDKK